DYYCYSTDSSGYHDLF
nr:immunoglobulin light chain junction region [Macaca mulatta]